jgi:hypothetical protein
MQVPFEGDSALSKERGCFRVAIMIDWVAYWAETAEDWTARFSTALHA